MAESRATIKQVLEAIAAHQPVVSQEGSLCIVMKLKNGRAKVRRIQGGKVQQAWVPLESLNLTT